MNNCIIYARVSTEKQEDARSLENQIKRCISYAEARGFNVIKILSDVESGSKSDRKSYLNLKEYIKNKSFNILVVWEISRISRNATEFLNFSEELRENEIDLVCIQQNIDMSTPIGKATANLLAVIGELERDTIKTRVKDRMIQLIKSGRYIGKKPFGYNLINKELIINSDEAEIIKDIFYRYYHGESREKIANFYNLSVSTITRRLTNPLYIGKIHYMGKNRSSKDPFIVEGNHQAIIEPAFFELIQEMINSFKYQRTSSSSPFVLSGLVYCECNFKMYGNHIKNRNISYYSCRNKNNKIKHSSIRKEQLEEYVVKELKKKINNQDIEYEPEKIDQKKKKILLLKKQLKIIETKRKKLKTLYLESYISINEFGKENKEFEEQSKKIQNEINTLLSPEEKIDKNTLKIIISKKMDTINNNPIKLKKICFLAINKIIVKNKNIFIEFNF